MNLDERIAALSEISYYVTQQNGTERPFTGALNKEYRPGDYYCIV
ncbi:MAG: peptide-methionine (R)-S-oxide reductase, partial [Candidatus Thermoplasmatota archaeon]|nr:peptide-methionine (R)-S-oxide reductase [Candidatus Thermoplasmatota archaeon]